MPAYAYVWEYRIDPARREAFLRLYRPDGAWCALFARADGYVRTDLLQDPADPDRYLTVDVWESRAHWDRFRATFAAEFDAIDARGEACTREEREIGRFDVVAPADD